MVRVLGLMVSHLAMLGIGFALGVYLLPVLIAPPSPSAAEIEEAVEHALFTSSFDRERQDSDFLHWGEGEVALSADMISFSGQLAPGPDYQLYLSPQYIETEVAFNQLKPEMVRIGAIKTFDGFMLPITNGVDIQRYNTVVVWCETFGEFITSGKYR